MTIVGFNRSREVLLVHLITGETVFGCVDNFGGRHSSVKEKKVRVVLELGMRD